jgi:hypothetical protein
MALPGISGCLGVVDLRPSWGWYASVALSDSLQLCSVVWVSLVSTCRLYYSRPRHSFLLFYHQTSHAAYFNARDYVLYEIVFNARLLSLSLRPIGNPVSDRTALDLTTLGTLQTGRLLSWLLFSFWPTYTLYIRSMDGSTTSSWPSQGHCAYTSLGGLMRHRYPWVSNSPSTRLKVVPDKWVRPTKRPADLSVGLPDLTCGPKDENKAWRASQGNPDELRQLG